MNSEAIASGFYEAPEASSSRSCRSTSFVLANPNSHRLRVAGASRVKWSESNADDGGADLFAHYSGIKAKGFRTLKENQKVEYQVQQGQKGPQAVEIDIVA